MISRLGIICDIFYCFFFFLYFLYVFYYFFCPKGLPNGYPTPLCSSLLCFPPLLYSIRKPLSPSSCIAFWNINFYCYSIYLSTSVLVFSSHKPVTWRRERRWRNRHTKNYTLIILIKHNGRLQVNIKKYNNHNMPPPRPMRTDPEVMCMDLELDLLQYKKIYFNIPHQVVHDSISCATCL